MLTVSELKQVLKAHRLRLTAQRGQHYLVDPHVIRRLIACCEPLEGQTVVEIGAGLGALTEALAERAARVIAVEIDAGISSLLAERMARWKSVAVAHEDILAFSWERAAQAVVVGAIPYHITSHILASLCEHRRTIRRAILIIQEEVADRLLAQPGTKAYGRLSLLVQYGWETAKLVSVPRHAFSPRPAVDSCCLRLTPRAREAVAVQDETLLFALIRAAFSQRRKTLVNCLAGFRVRPLKAVARAERSPGLSKEEAEAIVRQLGLSPSVRGERLSLHQFAALADRLARGAGNGG